MIEGVALVLKLMPYLVGGVAVLGVVIWIRGLLASRAKAAAAQAALEEAVATNQSNLGRTKDLIEKHQKELEALAAKAANASKVRTETDAIKQASDNSADPLGAAFGELRQRTTPHPDQNRDNPSQDSRPVT